MTQESTVLDDTALDAAAESIVTQLRADMKPRRTWKRTKADFEQRISDILAANRAMDGCLHTMKVDLLAAYKSRTRYAAIAFVLGCGFGGAIGWLLS